MKVGDMLRSDKDGFSLVLKLESDSALVYHFRTKNKMWINKNHRLHRVGGPAMKIGDINFWYQNGLLHREDGPALERPNDPIEKLYHGWYRHGQRLERLEVDFLLMNKKK